MESYKTDDSQKQVKLKVDVGTSGIAATMVYLQVNDEVQFLFESKDFSNGDIPFSKVGINKNLKNTQIIIVVGIDLSQIQSDKWKNEVKIMTALFTLNGGPEDEKIYKKNFLDVNDLNLPKVYITKNIDFV